MFCQEMLLSGYGIRRLSRVCVCVCVVEDAVDQASQVKRMDVEGLSAMQD